jgi:LCP family protein required for cell wall assembly
LERQVDQAGRRSLVATVEQLTGASVDHYAEVNLAGFADITEAVGGVPVCLNAPVRDTYSDADLSAGPQTLQGAAAPAFVRQRHGLPPAATSTGSCASRRSWPASPTRCCPRERWPTRRGCRR